MALSFSILGGSDSFDEVSEAYKTIPKITQTADVQDDEAILEIMLTLRLHLALLEKHSNDVFSSVIKHFGNSESVEQKLENVRALVTYAVFMKKILEEDTKPSVAVSATSGMIVRFPRHSSDYMKHHIKKWAEVNFCDAYLKSIVALSDIYTSADADLDALKQFLEEMECPQSLRDDILVFLDGNFKRNRKWTLKNKGSFMGHLESMDNTSVTIHKEKQPDEMIVVNMSDLSNIDWIFVNRVQSILPSLSK